MLEVVFFNSLGVSQLGFRLICWAQRNDYNAPSPMSKGGSFTPEMAIEWIADQIEDGDPYPQWTLVREELGFGPDGACLMHEHLPGLWRLTALVEIMKPRSAHERLVLRTGSHRLADPEDALAGDQPRDH